ncbi:putative nucleic acid-binding protein [Silvibacterium bohemicum]|uniref:Putative nucleic acid-binding protein n=1 Tax=Silvibacterium bohemicum TaxID=1577686 RepID=A0A841JWM8_9BACT|nr:PIN domain-containing protein [Silvibacterium bohemicum]MBB6144965.1 putative nucleic acid-binding protein [Silvibacterium bohemicum]
MSGRFFLDTNIFIYSLDGTAPKKAHRALELISEGVTSGRGIISYQVVQEFFNFALRKAKTPMTIPDAEQYLRIILRPLLFLHSSEAFFGEALHVQGSHRLSWYDSLIVAAAIRAESAILYSEDLQHGQYFGRLQVKNPFL